MGCVFIKECLDLFCFRSVIIRLFVSIHACGKEKQRNKQFDPGCNTILWNKGPCCAGVIGRTILLQCNTFSCLDDMNDKLCEKYCAASHTHAHAFTCKCTILMVIPSCLLRVIAHRLSLKYASQFVNCSCFLKYALTGVQYVSNGGVNYKD